MHEFVMVLNTYISHLFLEKPFEIVTLFMVYYTVYLITITTKYLTPMKEGVLRRKTRFIRPKKFISLIILSSKPTIDTVHFHSCKNGLYQILAVKPAKKVQNRSQTT